MGKTTFSILVSVLASAAAVSATPANATVTLNPNGSYTVSGASGGTISLNLDGWAGGPQTINGLTSALSLTFASLTNGGTTYNFNYIVDNSSSSPITASTVTGFGFNTNPNISGASSTGIFNNAQVVNQGGGSNIPNFGNIDVCFNAGNSNSCAGAGSGANGVQINDANATGTLSLTFAVAPGTIVLSDFYDRYQAIAGAGQVTSAIGRPMTPSVPEPGTWAMMLLGFGGIGYSMRRRRRSTAIAQLA